MDDALLASRAAAGDLDSFGQLYDRYFTRVYDFAWRTLGDGADAAAATEDAFGRTIAALQQPGNAPTFRALLFHSAHEAVLARADVAASETRTGPAHEEAFGAFEVPDPSHVENAAVVRGDYELAAFTWEGLASLTARDYALLDLHLRQGLSSREIAHVLGTGKKDAETILKRMTRAASEHIDSYVLARRGNCPRLREALAPFAIPPLDEEARAAAQAHVASCETCEQDKLRLPPTLEVLAAFTAVGAPLALKGDVWGSIASRWRIPAATAEDTLFEDEPFGEVERNPYGPRADASDGGMPPYYPPVRAYRGEGAEWSRNKVVLFAAAAIGLLVFAFAGGAVIMGAIGGDDDGGDAVAADPTVDTTPGISTPAPGISTTPGVVVETPTEDPNATPTATATEEPTETPAPEPTSTEPPAPPTATPVPPSPTPVPPDPNATPTRGALIPIGTPQGP